MLDTVPDVSGFGVSMKSGQSGRIVKTQGRHELHERRKRSSHS